MGKTIIILLIFLFAFTGCGIRLHPPVKMQKALSGLHAPTAYEPGETYIDEIFPYIKKFNDPGDGEIKRAVPAAGYTVMFDGFTPRSIEKDGKHLLDFKAERSARYRSSRVGVAHLLGPASTQIYIASYVRGKNFYTKNDESDFAGVQYWVIDVTSGKPASIYNSEDWGHLTGLMGVFDAEGDGNFEIYQADVRAFNHTGNCESCSPMMPRGVLRYDPDTHAYVPAKNVSDDFVQKKFDEAAAELKEKNTEFKGVKITYNFDIPRELQFREGELREYHQNLNEHLIDIFFLGETEKAWNDFEKFYQNDPEKEEARAAIKKFLAESKFYQALTTQK